MYRALYFPGDPKAPIRRKELLEQLADECWVPRRKGLEQSICKSKDEISSLIDDITCTLRKGLSWGDPKSVGLPISEISSDLRFLFPSPEDVLVRVKGDEKVTVRELEGKYIMVCCMSVPACWNSFALSLSLACFELYDLLQEKFEMVIVAKMMPPYILYDFNHFISGFPPSCLVVPYKDVRRRESICEFLGLGTLESKGLLLGPDRTVLRHSDLRFLVGHGAVDFPFDDEVLTRSSCDRENVTPDSLERFLMCSASQTVFRKVVAKKADFEVKSISEIKRSNVWLYVYATGNKLGFLRNIEKECREFGVMGMGAGFEVVVAYVPRCHEIDPREFIECLSSVLAEQNVDWWFVPFNNSAYHRLQIKYSNKDTVIVFSPRVEHGDPHGLDIMQFYRYKEKDVMNAYPFTLTQFAKDVVQKLSQVPLQKLLDIRGYLQQQGYNPATTTLLDDDKDVLLYFDWGFRPNPDIYKPLADKYDSLKKINPNLEAVYVCCRQLYKVDVTDVYKKIVAGMPWLILPCKINHFRKICKLLSDHFGRVFPTIFAFKNGKICSLRAHLQLSSPEAEALLSHEDFLSRVDMHQEAEFLLADCLKDPMVDWLMG